MTSELDLEQLEKVARGTQPQMDGPWASLANRFHVATFDPPTVLALIARLRKAEAKVERVEAIHRPMRVVLYPGTGERVMEVCAECRTRSGDWQRWPCPTIRALGEEA